MGSESAVISGTLQGASSRLCSLPHTAGAASPVRAPGTRLVETPSGLRSYVRARLHAPLPRGGLLIDLVVVAAGLQERTARDFIVLDRDPHARRQQARDALRIRRGGVARLPPR